MLEFLAIVVLLVVFAPLWIALGYLGAVLLLYLVVFLGVGALAAFLILWAGGTGWVSAIGGLIAAFYAIRGLAYFRAEKSTWPDTTG